LFFSLSLPQRQAIDNLIDLSIKSEDLNYNGIWLGDHYFNRNIFVALGLISRSTNQILLGTGVTNPFHYSAAILASTGCSLQELSNGRFRMGIGTGDTQTLLEEGISKPSALLRTMVNNIEFIRKLSSGISVKNQSNEIDGSMPATINYAGKHTAFPVMLGALGNRMIEIAARYCDGVLINSSNKDDIQRATRIVMKIREEYNLSTKFQIVPFTLVEVKPEGKQPSEFIKSIIAKIVSDLPSKYISDHDLSKETILKINNALIHRDTGKIMDLIDQRLVDMFSITGTMDEVVERLLEFEGTNFISEIVIGGTGYPGNFSGFIEDISHHLPLKDD